MMKGVAVISWFGHFTLAWMVTDIMLQDTEYPNWAPGIRKRWRKSKSRIFAFWIVSLGMTAVVILLIALDLVKWDSMMRIMPASNEMGRSFLAAFIVCFDIVQIMQDWDFPSFQIDPTVNLPGFDRANLKFELCCIKFELKGKWFTYGLIGLVLVVDMWNWKNQIRYVPFDYGQYTHHGTIFSVKDKEWLKNANESMVTYAWRYRNGSISEDYETACDFKGYSSVELGGAFVPVIGTFVFFILLGITESKKNKAMNKRKDYLRKKELRRNKAEKIRKEQIMKDNLT